MDSNTIHINPNSGTGKKFGKTIGIIIAVVLLLVVALNSFAIVPGGSTGVVVTLGKISDNVLQEGLHFKIPFVQQINKISNKIKWWRSKQRPFPKICRRFPAPLP